MPLPSRRQVLALGASVVGSFGGACRTNGNSPERILVSASPTLSMCSLYLAQELGYFAEAGLQVDVREIREPRVTLPMIAGGKLDVSFTAFAPTVVNAIAKGARLKLVAGREIAAPGCGDFGAVYGTRKRFPEGIQDFRVLKGKTIAVRRAAGIGEFALETELASAGLPFTSVRTAPYTEAEAMAALLGGHVDGLVSQGNVDRGHAAAAELVRTPGLGKVLPNFQYSFVIFGARLLDSPPELGARFLSAYFRATREFLQGRTPKFMEDFAKTNGLDFGTVRGYCRGTFVPDGAIDFGSVQRFVDWAVRKGYCETVISMEQAADLRFLELARQPERGGTSVLTGRQAWG